MSCKIPFLIAFVFYTLNVSAIICPDLKTKWFDKYITDFKVQWDPTNFNCRNGEDLTATPMYDLESARFTPIANGKTPNFYSYVTRHIRELHYDDKCDYLAYTLSEKAAVYLCKPFYDHSREIRASTLVHEARHIEEPLYHGHVTCTGGAYVGNENACDDKFYGGKSQGSGFNFDIYFYAWMIHDDSLNELDKDLMQSAFNGIFPDRFNEVSDEDLKKWRN